MSTEQRNDAQVRHAGMRIGACTATNTYTSYVVAKNVMVPMRDGTRLATDIYRPADNGEPLDGTFPTILGRTSYDKENLQMWIRPVGEFFSSHGYVVAIQDLRGRHKSEGTGEYFHTCNPRDGQDGFDTVEWIASQDWSNGRVGTVGSSQGAIAQHTLALHSPPHLSAMWPDAGPTNIFDHEAREGGAMALHMFAALFMHAQDSQEIRDDPASHTALVNAMKQMRDLVQLAPLEQGRTPLRHVPNLEKTLFDYYYRGTYDDFWSQECCDQERYFDRHADVPVSLTCGWWDPFSAGVTRYYTAMAAQNTSPAMLTMGPWTHDSMHEGCSFAGDVDFGPDSVWGEATYNQERLRWFDRWLKDEGTSESQPAGTVRIFVMGGGDGSRNRDGRLQHGGRWRTEIEWPLARTQHTTLYLHSAGRLTDEPPAADASPRAFSFDPSHPVPTTAANVGSFFELISLPPEVESYFGEWIPNLWRMRPIVQVGGVHQKEEPGMIAAREPFPLLAARPDVLVFETDLLQEAVS